MSGPSKVIVLDPDPRASRQVQLGFEREGVETIATAIPDEVGKLAGLPLDDAALVMVGGADAAGLALVRRVRAILTDAKSNIALVFAGKNPRRADVEAAGADEAVLQPAYLRDVITVGRLLRGLPATKRHHFTGSLVETTGVYTLVRALAALGRSAVLTLIRGLRRGEIRFYRGEVTSAQVGLIHGQAALHQLLLWTDARFDYHHEDIVRRQQIPLDAEELFADAERFLEGVRDSAGRLSPAMVLDQDVQRVQQLGSQIPTEVHGVLRMFDGHRVLADVLEDSPYRVFETLRVTQRAMEAGLLKPIEAQRPKSTWRAVLAIEEWLVGNEPKDQAVVSAVSGLEASGAGGAVTGPIKKQGAQGSQGSKKSRRKKKRLNTAPSMKAVKPGEIDWGALVPRMVGAEVGPLSQVVPAAAQHGEIEVAASRGVPREKLEALDTQAREKFFPSDVDPMAVTEPKVVWRDEAAKLEAKQKADAAAATATAKKKADDEAAAKKKADDEAVAAAAKKKADDEAVAAAAKKKADDEAAAAAAKKKADDEAAAAAKKKADDEAAAAAAKKKADDEAVAAAKKKADDKAAAAAAKKKADDEAVAAAKKKADDEAAARASAVEAARAIAQAVTATPPVIVAETPHATVTVSETVTAVTDHATDTATLTATQTVVVRESNGVVAAASVATAIELDDSGAQRQRIAALDTAPLPTRSRQPSKPPQTSEHAAKAGGEIVEQPAPTAAAPDAAQPSILIADLANVHAAVSAIATAQATAAPTKNAATDSREREVANVRADAAAFTDDEEAFFRAGSTTAAVPLQPAEETFEDLDEGYQPQSFWDRVLGKRPIAKASAKKPQK